MQHFFDVTQFAKVKLTFSVKSLIVRFQFLDYCVFLTCFGCWRDVYARLVVRVDSLVDLAAGNVSLGLHQLFLLGGRCYFVASHDIEERLALSALGAVVGLACVVKVEVSFHPLAELKIILVLGLHEFVNLHPKKTISLDHYVTYIYMSLDPIL